MNGRDSDISGLTSRSVLWWFPVLSDDVKTLQTLLSGHWMDTEVVNSTACWNMETNKYLIYVNSQHMSWHTRTNHHFNFWVSALTFVGSELQWKRDADVYVCVCTTGSEGNWGSSSSSPGLSLFEASVLITTICFYSDYTGAQVLKSPSCWPGPRWLDSVHTWGAEWLGH